MKQAIITKFLGPNGNLGPRVKARCEAGSLTLGWDYALDPAGNHRRCAEGLICLLGWQGRRFEGGSLPGGGYAFVDIGPVVHPSSTETDG